jgi:hypothetical protein
VGVPAKTLTPHAWVLPDLGGMVREGVKPRPQGPVGKKSGWVGGGRPPAWRFSTGTIPPAFERVLLVYEESNESMQS